MLDNNDVIEIQFCYCVEPILATPQRGIYSEGAL